MSGSVDRRERPPWKPQRDEYIRIWGTSIAIHEWLGFMIVLSVAAALVVIAVALL